VLLVLMGFLGWSLLAVSALPELGLGELVAAPERAAADGSAATLRLGDALLAALARLSGPLAAGAIALTCTPKLAALALLAGSLGNELALAWLGLLAPCPPPQALTARATRQRALGQMLERMVQAVRRSNNAF
jgi:hypothetical protein